MKTFNARRTRANARHTVNVMLILPSDEGGVEQVEVEVCYRGLSLLESSQFKELAGLEPNERAEEIVRQLAFIVDEIPAFVGDDNKSVACDEEFFGGLDVSILNAISEAIAEAREVPTKAACS
jgi:hypothetical protein